MPAGGSTRGEQPSSQQSAGPPTHRPRHPGEEDVEHQMGRNPEGLTAEAAMPGDIPHTLYQQQQRSGQEELAGE
jgi:hypothetical protein